MKVTVKMYTDYQKKLLKDAKIVNGQPQIDLGNEVEAKTELLANACDVPLDEIMQRNYKDYQKKLKELDALLSDSKKG